MQFVLQMLQRQIRHHADRYEGVLIKLDEALGSYEAGRSSINAYLATVCAIDQGFRRERALWLRLCDWSLVLRWINRSERRSFREACDALDWCRNWAVRQRGVDVTSCLRRVAAAEDLGFGQCGVAA